MQTDQMVSGFVTHAAAYIEKQNEKVTLDKNEDIKRINLGLMVQGGCRALCYYEDSPQILDLSSQFEAETLEICVPKAHKFIGIAPCSCKHSCKECRFYVLLYFAPVSLSWQNTALTFPRER